MSRYVILKTQNYNYNEAHLFALNYAEENRQGLNKLAEKLEESDLLDRFHLDVNKSYTEGQILRFHKIMPDIKCFLTENVIDGRFMCTVEKLDGLNDEELLRLLNRSGIKGFFREVDDLKERKENILSYIISNMDEYEFDRGCRDDDDLSLGFTHYEEFVKYQEKVIDEADEEFIKKMEFLRDEIIPNSQLMDKEDMGLWETSGFAFSSEGKFVIFHER